MPASAFRSVVITGASSGIGAALARAYAGPGVTMGLTGRDAARLGATAKLARAAGAVVEAGVFDVRDRPSLAAFLKDFDAASPVALMIANAGILDGRREKAEIEDAEIARRVVEVNLLGSIDTLHGVLPGMRRRRQGQIVLISSLAALSPLADAPAYSASKAGLLSYGLALRAAVAADNIGVSVVCPGYVTSAMTEMHIGPHPHEISADRAARLIHAGIARNKAVIGFPATLYALSRVSTLLPDWLNRRATRSLRFHIARAD